MVELPSGHPFETLKRSAHLLAGAAATAFVIAVVTHFHKHFWWPPDDGAYAYVAQRLLHGDVLNRDIQDIHAGYVHFIHAAALSVFGEDILSLRYPLALLTVLQSAIVYGILLPRGVFAACAGAVASGSLTFVQFLNPSANWYVLFVAFVVIACGTLLRKRSPAFYVTIGFLLGVSLLLRQLSGVFLAMGTIAWLLSEPEEDRPGSWLAKASLLVIASGLVIYLVSKASIAAFLMFGLWPLAATALIWRDLRISNASVVRMYALIAAGMAIAMFPLLVYHLSHGSLSQWFDDAVVSALHLNALEFVSEPSFGIYLLQVLVLATREPSLNSLLSGFYWVVLLCLPVAVGLLMLKRALNGLRPRYWGPVTAVALFFAPVSVHYQIPIYLTYTSCLTLVALLSLARSRSGLWVIASLSFLLSAIGLLLHAGQPVSRGLAGVIRGDSITLDASDGIARASIAMETSDALIYSEIVSIIERHSDPGDRILALPFIPEFYFLSQRQSAFRFIGTPFGIHNRVELAAVIKQMSDDPPRVIVNRREDKYHSPLSLELVEYIKANFVPLKAVGDFDVYAAKADQVP